MLTFRCLDLYGSVHGVKQHFRDLEVREIASLQEECAAKNHQGAKVSVLDDHYAYCMRCCREFESTSNGNGK
jgi:hypothetical protein